MTKSPDPMDLPQERSMNSLVGDLYRAAERPYNVTIELTRRCNLQCVHCYAEPERGRPELTTEELDGLLVQIRDLGALFVTLIGGEPTVQRDWLRLVRRVTDLRMCTTLVTNGTVIDETAADVLAEQTIFHVSISLYGATPGTHDAITRRPGSFERTVAGIRSLRKRGLYVVIKFLIQDLNAAEFEAMVRLAEELGAPCFANTAVQPRDNLDRGPVGLRAPLSEIVRIKRAVREYVQRSGESGGNGEDLLRPGPPGAGGGFGRGMPEPPSGCLPGRALSPLDCTAGKTLLMINAYGDVFTCLLLPIAAGNVRYASLRTIWEEAPLLRFFRRSRHLERLHGCPECALRGHCVTCPGTSFTGRGDVFGPSAAACVESVARWLSRGRPGGQVPVPAGLLGEEASPWGPEEVAGAIRNSGVRGAFQCREEVIA